MTRLWRLARRYTWGYVRRGKHHTWAWQLSTAQAVALLTEVRARRYARQPSPLEELFHTVALPAVPMPQPVSPAPVNATVLHDWAVAS